MPVYYAYTRDGDQFDGTVAVDAKNAEKIIRHRHRSGGIHFVGGREQTAEELLDGMIIKHMPHIPDAVHMTVEQRAEEEAAVGSGQTLQRLNMAIESIKGYKTSE